MKKLYTLTAILAVTLLSSCELIGDIFKTGFYAGIFIVIAVIALIIWILSRIRK